MGALRPILKWAGSKRLLAETVRRAFDAAPVRYREPCVGAGWVYVQRLVMGELRPGPHVLLGDLNPALMAFYRGLRAAPRAVLGAMEDLPWDAGWRPVYDTLRTTFNAWAPGPSDEATPDQAALLLWMNRACFNGLFRVSREGKFNTPAGSYEVLARPGERDVLAFAEALAGVQLVCAPFQVTLADAREGDQVYIDPPYMGAFSGYTALPWGYDEQVRLALAAADARARGAHVVASNADLPQVRALWAGLGFDVREARAYHSVGAAAERRRDAQEVLLLGRPPRRRSR